jgi:hypothetical protein
MLDLSLFYFQVSNRTSDRLPETLSDTAEDAKVRYIHIAVPILALLSSVPQIQTVLSVLSSELRVKKSGEMLDNK